MSLFGKPAQNGTEKKSVAAPGSLFGSKTEYDAKQAAEKKRLAEAEVSYGTCICGVDLTGANISKLPNGKIVHVGCTRAGVSPPDAPEVTPATAAKPMTPEQIVKVEDPEIRQRATEHAALHVQTQPAQPMGGRCSRGNTKVLMNEKQKLTRQIACPNCGKEYKKIKDEQLDITDNQVYWIVPGHNIPKGEPAPVLESAPAPAPAPAPIAAPALAPVPEPAPTPSAEFVQLSLPHMPEPAPVSAPAPAVLPGIIPLEDYYRPLCDDLATEAEAADIRCAGNDTALGYGRWKGALAALVRALPPAPGIYLAHSNDEIAQEVINTLRPLCSVGGIMIFIDVAIERGGAVVRGTR